MSGTWGHPSDQWSPPLRSQTPGRNTGYEDDWNVANAYSAGQWSPSLRSTSLPRTIPLSEAQRLAAATRPGSVSGHWSPSPARPIVPTGRWSPPLRPLSVSATAASSSSSPSSASPSLDRQTNDSRSKASKKVCEITVYFKSTLPKGQWVVEGARGAQATDESVMNKLCDKHLGAARRTQSLAMYMQITHTSCIPR